MTDATYRTIAAHLRAEPEPIKASRHLATLTPTPSVDEAKARIAEVRAEMPSANHHAWAYRIRDNGIAERCSDDGEPTGTAGRPILRQLELRELWNCTLIVTRFFGGTKLGSGGLVRAYGGAAAFVLDEAEITTIVPERRLRIRSGYAEEPLVRRTLSESGLEPDQVEHGAGVEFLVTMREPDLESLCATLIERSNGRVECIPL